MSTEQTGLVPVTTDPDTAGFFAAARDGVLAVQHCTACGGVQQPPRPRCVSCLGTELEWSPVQGPATVHSWTVVEHQINPAFPAPYTVLLVDVADPRAEHPVRFLGRIDGRHEPLLGAELELVFDHVGTDQVAMPNWRLAD